MRKVGVPMYAHSVWRTPEEQQARYVAGHSKAKAGQSPHQYGLAVDLIHGIRGWDMPDDSWRMIGHIGKEVAAQNGVPIVWGGDFKSLYDPAHWELKGWRDLAGL
nr:MAG: hypothetical protein [Microvirus sp.]